MSLELQRFQETLRDHAGRNDHAIALWGDTLKLDYATLYAEVLYRQERLRDEQVQVIALALDNGVDAMLWDLAVLFEGLTCVTLAAVFQPGTARPLSGTEPGRTGDRRAGAGRRTARGRL